ncbi:MAG: DoxX family protein, partial [Chitinophagaceae bacterium]
MKKDHTAYLLARLPIALSMFGHGLVRIPKLSKFSEGMVNNFSSKNALPVWLVQPFSLVLPFAELIVGLLLFIGLFTRLSIIGGSVVILALIFGSAMLEEWNSIFSQMFYGAYFAVLFYFIHLN